MIENFRFTEHEHRLLKLVTCPTRVSRSARLWSTAATGSHRPTSCKPGWTGRASWRNTMWMPSGAQLGFSFFAVAMASTARTPGCNIHGEMLKAPVAYPCVHAKAIRWPSGCQRRIGRLTGTGVSLSTSPPIHTHPVNLLRTGAAGRKHDIASGLRIYFGLDFDGARRRDRPETPFRLKFAGENPATPSGTRGTRTHKQSASRRA